VNLALGEAQLSILWACLSSPRDGWSQRDLARALAVSPAHVSGLVEQLRSQGLLAGRRNLHDRRRQHWQLTPAGRERLQSLFEGLTDWATQLDSQLDLAELLTLTNRLSEVLSSGLPTGKLGDELHQDGSLPEASGVDPARKRGAA
jgi:DNA-binding MarR family transcriptional regulator